MILADTSVWIQFQRGQLGGPLSELELLSLVTVPPVIQELFQGLADRPGLDRFRESVLALPRLADPVPLNMYLEAAEIYRDLRRRGITVRSSVDCLIAAIAIANRVAVWHVDRDFDAIAKHTRLSLYARPMRIAGNS